MGAPAGSVAPFSLRAGGFHAATLAGPFFSGSLNGPSASHAPTPPSGPSTTPTPSLAAMVATGAERSGSTGDPSLLDVAAAIALEVGAALDAPAPAAFDGALGSSMAAGATH